MDVVDANPLFQTPMGKEKPIPRILKLKPEHVEQMGGQIKFTPARFNVGAENERSIVTSTGPYIITWNFRKVKQNRLNEYTMKKYGDVVGTCIRFPFPSFSLLSFTPAQQNSHLYLSFSGRSFPLQSGTIRRRRTAEQRHHGPQGHRQDPVLDWRISLHQAIHSR